MSYWLTTVSTELATAQAAALTYGDPIRLVDPEATAEDLDRIRDQIRVDSDQEIILLDQYLRAAIDYVEDYTGLGLIRQTWTQTFGGFCAEMILWRRPLLSVGEPPAAVAIQYVDAEGALMPLDPADYQVLGIGSARYPSRVRVASGGSWPSTQTGTGEAVTVTYHVGFGEHPKSVPPLIRQAIRLTAATWFEFRENLVAGSLNELPEPAKALLRQWRPLAVA
jgi:uncharacterized phiE125 gp8 family phage protein